MVGRCFRTRHTYTLERYQGSMAEITKELLENVVKDSLTIAECLTKLGMAKSRDAYVVFYARVKRWGISTSHFLSTSEFMKRRHQKSPEGPGIFKRPALESVLIENSSYSRSSIKARLLAAGLKNNMCELCGQDEMWMGKKMHLILDHINGIRNDNRLENLRIICPNCDATLPTFGGRNNKRMLNTCLHCGTATKNKSYCSRKCAQYADSRKQLSLRQRRAARPSYEQLLREIEEYGYLQTGKNHGVSDNAIRKWVIQYEKENSHSTTS